MSEPFLRTEQGWVGIFTRAQAEGAIPNGETVVKVASEKGDGHPIGARATVLGSLSHPSAGLGYFVEWEDCPRMAVGVIAWKIAKA